MDIVRNILCSFYDDGEIMVANFLLEGDCAYTDQQIAESLGLPQRQVRSILEARLCKDYITEAEIPSSGGHIPGHQFSGGSSAWYRISPDIINATWYRLTQTEKAIHDKLKSVQESESYLCTRCVREFDALRAVSLYSGEDGLFHCDICEDVLQMRDNRSLREEVERTLSKFYEGFETLKEKLESLTKMYIPRHIVIKKTVHEKLLLEMVRKESNPEISGKRTFAQFQSAISNLSESTLREASSSAPSWIKEAQGGVKREEKVVVTSPLPLPSMVVKTEPILPSTKDLHTILATSQTKKEETEVSNLDDVSITVAGTPYSLGDVRENDSLIERMTDEEYSIFDKLMQQLGFS